eukprot:365274-Chlamydomonas_euryale.AAC.9
MHAAMCNAWCHVHGAMCHAHGAMCNAWCHVHGAMCHAHGAMGMVPCVMHGAMCHAHGAMCHAHGAMCNGVVAQCGPVCLHAALHNQRLAKGLIAADVQEVFDVVNPRPFCTHAATCEALKLPSVARSQIALWSMAMCRVDSSARPCVASAIPAGDIQTCVRFNMNNVNELMSNGKRRVYFWSHQVCTQPSLVLLPTACSCRLSVLDEACPRAATKSGPHVDMCATPSQFPSSHRFKYYSPPLRAKDFKQSIGDFTHSVFVPGSLQALTATSDGDLVVWDEQGVTVQVGTRATDRRAIKLMRIHNSPVTVLTTIGDYVVSGGQVRADLPVDVPWYSVDCGAVLEAQRHMKHSWRRAGGAWQEGMAAGHVCQGMCNSACGGGHGRRAWQQGMYVKACVTVHVEEGMAGGHSRRACMLRHV